MNLPPPNACTLNPDDASKQLLQWSDLQASALTKKAMGKGVRLTFPGTLRDQIERLIEQEQACCPFLTFSVRADGFEVAVDVETSDLQALPLILDLAGVTVDG